MRPANLFARLRPKTDAGARRLVRRALLVLLGLAGLSSLATSRTEPARPPVFRSEVDPGVGPEQFQFLFDDEWVDDRRGVRRVIRTPTKLPAPVLQGERSWERSGIHPTLGLFYDPDQRKFRMWYKAVCPEATPVGKEDRSVDPSEQQVAERTFLCYAESLDGLTWMRPSLGSFAFDGSSANNIIQELPVGDSVFHNVVKDPLDPDPSRRYKAIGFQMKGASSLKGNPGGGPGLYVSYSPDGLSWPKEPVLVMTSADLTDSNCILPQRDPLSGNWVGFFRPRTTPKRRFIGYSESRDFDHWTYPRMLLTPDAQDAEWTEFYGLTATVLGSWRLGSLWIFHNNPAFSPVTSELVYSRDGQRYQRAMPGQDFIPLGGVGGFDSRTVYPLAWVERGSEFFVYYSGSNIEHGSDRGIKMQREIRTPNGESPVWGVGLARLPWGHFCGLRADTDGMVETKWLTNYGNGGVQTAAALEPDGSVQAQILDQYGSAIPGWERENSRTRVGEKGKLFFSWGRDDLDGRFAQTSARGGKIGHVVKLRFYLHKATLFGFQVGRPGSRPDYIEGPPSR